MLSEALRLIRVFHDMKQVELAELLRLSKSYVSEIESGKKVPTMEVIDKYANEFNIPASSILFFSEQLGSDSKHKLGTERARGVIANKVLNFLQIIEQKTEHVSENTEIPR